MEAKAAADGARIHNRTTREKSRSLSPFIKEMKTNLVLYCMLIPGTVLVFLFAYLPMAGVLIAFKDLKFYGSIFQSFMKSKWVGLKNFEYLFAGEAALEATRNTILYNMAFIFLGLILAVALAIILNEIRSKRMAKFYQTTFLLPYFLSWVIVSYFVYSLLSPGEGLMNNLLSHFNIPSMNWYNEPKFWPFIIIFIGIWKSLGFNTIIYTASISTIDVEYYEAAQLDGATKLQQARYITIPAITPLMIILTILAIGKIFNSDFGLFYNVPLNMGTLSSVTEVIDTYVYRMMRTNDYGMAAASGLYQAAVGFVLVLTTNTIVKKIDSEYSLF